jgi:sporulation protein YlmC with PRC-barrel domain
MPTAKEHEGKLLIGITDGKKLGQIRDLYFDAQVTKVVAVSLGTEGIFGRRDCGIDQTYVRVYGIDAWLVSGSGSAVDVTEIAGSGEFVLASDLRGREIVSEGGSKIATVGDVIVDTDGHVQGFTLSNVYVPGPVAERRTIPREAFTDMGSKSSPMITLLAKAEVWERPGL